jgi:lambda repressor-like predicted transcriptional regulator
VQWLPRRKRAMKNTSHALLQDALTRLKQRSPGVSIRALATRTGLSSSYLSKVFRGERPLP